MSKFKLQFIGCVLLTLLNILLSTPIFPNTLRIVLYTSCCAHDGPHSHSRGRRTPREYIYTWGLYSQARLLGLRAAFRWPIGETAVPSLSAHITDQLAALLDFSWVLAVFVRMCRRWVRRALDGIRQGDEKRMLLEALAERRMAIHGAWYLNYSPYSMIIRLAEGKRRFLPLDRGFQATCSSASLAGTRGLTCATRQPPYHSHLFKFFLPGRTAPFWAKTQILAHP